jgi:hypothetical protein
VGGSRASRKIAIALLALVCALQRAPAAEPEKTVEEITVFAHPTDADKVLHDFVHTFAAPAPYVDQIARWRLAVCPATYGLTPSFNDFITKRVKDVAALVKAGPKPKANCRPNVRIIFTHDAQGVVDQIRHKAPALLGFHYAAQEQDLATVRDPIQAWYATATQDYNGFVALDDADATCDLIPGQPPLPGPCLSARGSLFGPGFRSEFAVVTIVVDDGKVVGSALGALSDYIAVVALSQTKAFTACRQLPSIGNLWAADCDPSLKVAALSVSDIAYLKAVYQMTPDMPHSIQEDAIAKWMKKDLERR